MRDRAILLVAVANVLLAIVVGAMGWINDRDSDGRTRELCQFNNLSRSYELLNHSDGTSRLSLARDLLPILDCDATVDAGRPVPVTAQTQETYLRIVEDLRRWPILEDGAIVGTRPLPSEDQDR